MILVILVILANPNPAHATKGRFERQDNLHLGLYEESFPALEIVHEKILATPKKSILEEKRFFFRNFFDLPKKNFFLPKSIFFRVAKIFYGTFPAQKSFQIANLSPFDAG